MPLQMKLSSSDGGLPADLDQLLYLHGLITAVPKDQFIGLEHSVKNLLGKLMNFLVKFFMLSILPLVSFIDITIIMRKSN